MASTQPAYEYHATLRRVIDGDTLELEVDLGFEMHAVTTFRLYGVNAPEVTGATKKAGNEATAFTKQWLEHAGTPLLIRTYKRDKYGRWLAEVWGANMGKGPLTLNAALLQAGHATPMDDKGRAAP